MIEEAFLSTDEVNVMVETKGVFYPSDQAAFRCGVGVAALKATKGGMLYMDRIHTPRDTVFEERNIEFLTDASIKLVGAMKEGSK